MNEFAPLNQEKKPNYTRRRARALGFTAVPMAALLLAGCETNEPPKHTGLSVEEATRDAINNGPTTNVLLITSEMPQDGSTSETLEAAAEELRNTFSLSYTEGQQRATLEGAKEIERREHPIMPGEEFITWYDSETGHFISDRAPEIDD